MSKQSYEQFPGQRQRLGFSSAIKVDDTIYIAGTLGIMEPGLPLPETFEDQLRQIYRNLAAALSYFGGSLDDIVEQTVYVTDLDEALAAGHVRREIYADKVPPASTLVEVRRLALNAKVEIKATARLSR